MSDGLDPSDLAKVGGGGVGLLGLMLAFLKFFDASKERIAALERIEGLQQAQVARIAALETALAHMADTLKRLDGVLEESNLAVMRQRLDDIGEQLKEHQLPVMARSLQALESSNSEMRPVFHDCKQMMKAIVDRGFARTGSGEHPRLRRGDGEDGE